MLDSIFISVLNMSMVSGYVIMFVLIARLLFKKEPKIFSYVLWAVVLVRLLCPFSFESAIGLLPSNTEPIPQNIVYQDVPQIDTGINIIDSSVNNILPPVITPEASVNPIQIWGFIGSHIWLIGIAVMVVYSVVSLIKLRRKLIGATPIEKNIYIADHMDSPFVMGFIRPKIYLPSNLSDTERDFIIKHEQTHIKRFDHITRILAFISLAVHWFNPLVWIAFVLSGKDMETSCDESVMKKMNTDIRADYSEALLKFATGKKLIAATPLAFGEGDTKGRVKNVMKYKKPVVWVSAICLILVSVIAVSLMSNGKAIPQHYKDMYNMRIDVFDENSSQDIECMVNNFLVYPENVKVTDVESNASEIIIYISTDDKDTFENDNYWSNVDILSLLVNSIDVVKHNLNDGESVMSIDVDSGTGFEFDFNDGRDENVFYDMLDEIDEYRNSQANSNTLTPTNTQSHSSYGNIIDFEFIEVGTAKETIREKFGEPDTYGNWGYDEIYLLTDAQITISYDSDSETNSFVEDVNINTHARLSLNDIIMLSSKGEDLTWADFEEFPYIEGGSGVYIRAYDINDLFRFSIGGGLTDDAPMYMMLSAKSENEPSIDIRTENVTEFISRYNTAISTNVDGKVDTIQVILAGGNPAYGNKSKIITEPSEVLAFINAFDTFTVKENEETNDAMPSYYRLYDGDKLVEEYMFNGNDSTAMWIGQFVKLVEYESKSPYELYEQSTAEEVIVYQDSDYTKAVELARLFVKDNGKNKIIDHAQPKVEKLTITNTHKIFDLESNELFDIEGQTVYKVTFETEDDVLGPIVCYVDAGSFTVLGIDARR